MYDENVSQARADDDPRVTLIHQIVDLERASKQAVERLMKAEAERDEIGVALGKARSELYEHMDVAPVQAIKAAR
jgi:hypothetical protein